MIIATARDAAALVGPLLAETPGPRRILLHLDGEQRLLALVERAIEPGAPLPVRDIVADAVRRGSAGLVVADNVAATGAEPEAEDLEATRRLADAAASLGIILHDRLVFSGDSCRSFRELGLL